MYKHFHSHNHNQHNQQQHLSTSRCQLMSIHTPWRSQVTRPDTVKHTHTLDQNSEQTRPSIHPAWCTNIWYSAPSSPGLGPISAPSIPVSFRLSRPVPFRPVPFRSVPFRSVPSRPVPSRSVPSRPVPSRLAVQPRPASPSSPLAAPPPPLASGYLGRELGWVVRAARYVVNTVVPRVSAVE